MRIINFSCRFIIKAAPAPRRKDKYLGNVIINEQKVPAVRRHQVISHINFACWVIIMLLMSSANFFIKFFQEHCKSDKMLLIIDFVCWLFSKLTFFKKYFWNTSGVSNSLDPEENGYSVGPDLGLNCLQGNQQTTIGKKFLLGDLLLK